MDIVWLGTGIALFVGCVGLVRFFHSLQGED